MRKLEILIRNAKKHFNQIKLFSVVKVVCVVLVPLSFLCVARKIWCDKFKDGFTLFFNVNQTHVV